MIIGLDSADKDLIDYWVGEGVLPNFKALKTEAIWGDVRNPRGMEAGSCWPTFYFGLNPGETGQFDGARQFDPKTYRHVSYRPELSRNDPIWTTLSKAGKLCGVIDAPYSYPVGEINGIKISDRASHVPAGGGLYLNFRTHPPELAGEILDRFGPNPGGNLSSDLFRLETPMDYDRLRDMYSSRIKNKTDLTLHYWHTRPWDFFFCAFSEAHCIGHLCWHIHDKSSPEHDPALAKAVGDPVRAIYKSLDRAVGRILDSVRDEARVLVYLSHGMGPRRSGTRLLDRILVRLESGSTKTRNDPLMRTVRATWRRTPHLLRSCLKPLRDKVSSDGFQPNRKGRRFFEVFNNDRTAGIRINLDGREANGIVSPGVEYEILCAQLISDLEELKNAETGEPLIAEVLLARDFFKGRYSDCLPDILVSWNRTAPINIAWSPKFGTVDKTGLMDKRSGDHRLDGRFFAVADDWAPRRINEMVNVENFVPTIANLLSVEEHRTDGRVIAPLVQMAPDGTLQDRVEASGK